MQDVSIDSYRQRATKSLTALLCLPDEAKSLESVIYNVCQETMSDETSIMFKRFYLHKIRQIADNLDPKSYIGNSSLLSSVRAGSITYEALARASPQELFPANWQSLIDEKKRRDEIQYSSTAQAMTDKYTCRKCGSRKITYYDLQIRSADEGFTTFFTCLGCGGKWKKN